MARKGKRITRSLEEDATEKLHDGKIGIFRSVFLVGRCLIVALPVLFLLWFVVLLIHAALVSDWAQFETYGQNAMKILAPYFVGVFTKIGLLDKQR